MRYIILIIILTCLNFYLSYSQHINYTGIPHLDTAIYYYNLPTIEKTGNNDGKYVEYIIKNGSKRSSGKSREPWCAWLISFCTQVNDSIDIKFQTGLARNIKSMHTVPVKDVLYSKVTILPGWTINLRNGSTIFGHVGLVYLQISNNIWQTIEGNLGNRVNITQRFYNPRDYQRIHSFTPINSLKKLDSINIKPLIIKSKTSSNTR